MNSQSYESKGEGPQLGIPLPSSRGQPFIVVHPFLLFATISPPSRVRLTAGAPGFHWIS
jgi:hypothetical protein